MMRWCFILLVCLCGCDRPSPYFRDAPVTRVAVQGSVFDIRVRGNLAEALRVNSQYAPRLGPIRGRAAFAMAQVSGCQVLDVLGDQALTTGILSCDGRPPTWILPAVVVSYSCVDVVQWQNDNFATDYVEFDCDPY